MRSTSHVLQASFNKTHSLHCLRLLATAPPHQPTACPLSTATIPALSLPPNQRRTLDPLQPQPTPQTADNLLLSQLSDHPCAHLFFAQEPVQMRLAGHCSCRRILIHRLMRRYLLHQHRVVRRLLYQLLLALLGLLDGMARQPFSLPVGFSTEALLVAPTLSMTDL